IPLEPRRRPGDALERRRLVEFLRKHTRLRVGALLGQLALMNVRGRGEPANDATILVGERRAAAEMPAILPVASPKAHLEIGADGSLSDPADLFQNRRHVVRMDDHWPQVVAIDDVDEGEACVVEHGPIRILNAGLRTKLQQELGHEVDQHAELLLVLPELLFGPLAVLDVCAGAAPPHEGAPLVVLRLGTYQEPAIDAVVPAEPRLYLARFAGRQELPPLFHQRREIVRMERLLPSPTVGLFGRETRVVVPSLVQELVRPVRRTVPG